MNEITIFFTQWKKFCAIVTVSVIIVSIFLSKEINDWVYSLILIPITYSITKATFNNLLKKNNLDFKLALFIISFLISILSIIIFSYILIYYNEIPFISYSDDWNYNNSALEIANRWEKDNKFNLYTDVYLGIGTYSGYPNFSAFSMYLFGYSPYTPRIVQSIFSSFTCILIYLICKKYTTESKSRLVSIIAAFSPLLYIFSSVQLKDTLLLFLGILALNSILNLFYSKHKLKSLFLIYISFTGMVFFRPGNIIPFVIGMIFILIYRKTNKIKTLFLLVIVLLVFGYIWSYLSNTYILSDDAEYFSTRYNHMMNSNYSESNAKLASTSLSQFVGMPLYLLLSLFLPSPLLANLNSAESLNYTAIMLLTNITIAPFAILGFFSVIKKYKTRSFEIPLLIAIIFIAFKIGQAASLQTMLSARQSLTTLSLLFFFIPICPFTNSAKRNMQIILYLALIISIVYTIVRLYSHGQL